MDYHVITGELRIDTTLLLMNEDEYQDFLLRMAFVPGVNDEVFDILVETQYLPYLIRTDDTEKIFESYDVDTDAIIVLGPRGPEMAKIVLENLEKPNDIDPFPPFSLN